MNLLTRIRAYLFPQSTDSIVSSFTGLSKRLDKHATKQIKVAARKTNHAHWLKQDTQRRVGKLNSDATSRIADASKAAAIKTKLDDLFNA